MADAASEPAVPEPIKTEQQLREMFITKTKNASKSGYGANEPVCGCEGTLFVHEIFLLFSINKWTLLMPSDDYKLYLHHMGPGGSYGSTIDLLRHFIETQCNREEWRKRHERREYPFDFKDIRPVALMRSPAPGRFDLYLNVPIGDSDDYNIRDRVKMLQKPSFSQRPRTYIQPGTEALHYVDYYHPCQHGLYYVDYASLRQALEDWIKHDPHYAYAWEKPSMTVHMFDRECETITIDIQTSGDLFQHWLCHNFFEGFMQGKESHARQNFPPYGREERA